jgi:hypothetical protein
MWKGYDNAASMQFEEAMKNEEARKKKMAQVQRLVDDSNVGGFDLNEGKKFTVPLRLIEEQQNNIEKLDTWTKQKDQINEYRVALDQLAKISSKQEAGRGSAVDSKEQQRLETLFSVAKRLADPYERRVYDLEREQALTGAVTKEQKNQLEINDAILDIKETKGRIDDEEAKRLTAVLQKTQAIRAAAEAANQDYTLTKQMEAARQRSSLGQQQVQIEQAIADLIKEQGISLEDQLSLRQKMTDVANLEAFNQLADTADPVTAAIRSWVDNTRRLKDAYDTGLIPSAEKYAQMQQNLDRQTLSSRDPFGARLKTMREELQVAQFIGQQADIETDIQSDLNALKDQNVAVSKEQEQALRDYITSMYQLKVAQEASLQAWANGLGTWQEQLGHLQMSTADAVSDGLVDGFMDGDWKSAAAGMLKSIAKTYLKNGIDSFMAGIITKTGVGDNGGKDAFANAKKAAGQFGTLGQNALNANVAYVNTTSVVLQGPGIANITGAAPLGAVTRGGALKDLKGDIVSEVLNAGSGEGSLRGVGNFSKAGIQNVDPRLTAILSEAAKRSGMQVEAYSGYRAGDPRFHGQGLATDVRILDQAGKPIGGTNGNYQNPATFRQYELYAQNAKVAQQQMYPELNQQFRWGGYFGGTRGTYGAMDQMHFDLGGSRSAGMAGGSWQNGLNWGQKANFPGAQSMGIGQLQGSLNSLKTQFLGASTAATSAGANVSSFGQNVQQTGPAAQTAGNNVQQMNTKLNSTTPTVAGFGGAVSTSGSAAAGATQGFAGLGQGLGGLFSSIGGSLGGGAGAGLGIFGQLLGFMFHHNGGMAGHGTPGLSFGGSWRSAPKFHTGGGNNMGNDEYRAVLKQGERVLTADDDKRTAKLLKGRSGGSSTVGGVNVGGVNVTVNAGPSTGDKSRDDEHAKNMGKQVGNAVDQHMTEWVLNQMRPGGLFSTAAKR